MFYQPGYVNIWKFFAFSLYDMFTYLNVRRTKDLDASEHTGAHRLFFEYMRQQQSTFSKELKSCTKILQNSYTTSDYS